MIRIVLLLASGIWIGRRVRINNDKDREVTLRKNMERFIRENLPDMPAVKMREEIKKIMR